MKLIQMRRDDGHTVDVHPDMVEDYKSGGYQVTEAEAEDAPKRRGRPRKAG